MKTLLFHFTKYFYDVNLLPANCYLSDSEVLKLSFCECWGRQWDSLYVLHHSEQNFKDTGFKVLHNQWSEHEWETDDNNIYTVFVFKNKQTNKQLFFLTAWVITLASTCDHLSLLLLYYTWGWLYSVNHKIEFWFF